MARSFFTFLKKILHQLDPGVTISYRASLSLFSLVKTIHHRLIPFISTTDSLHVIQEHVKQILFKDLSHDNFFPSKFEQICRFPILRPFMKHVDKKNIETLKWVEALYQDLVRDLMFSLCELANLNKRTCIHLSDISHAIWGHKQKNMIVVGYLNYQILVKNINWNFFSVWETL
jgi:hypothetical protein